VAEDFKNWGEYLDLFYRNYKDKKLAIIKKNHIFSCDYSRCFVGNQLMVDVRESNLRSHPVLTIPMIKNGFYGQYGFTEGEHGLNDLPYDKKMPLKKAIAARRLVMKASKEDKLKEIAAQGLNIWKQVEMFSKYRKLIPIEYWNDDLYARPADHIMDAVKAEKAKRKNFREELNQDKKKATKVAKSEQQKSEEEGN
jgi:hypothetical protein